MPRIRYNLTTVHYHVGKFKHHVLQCGKNGVTSVGALSDTPSDICSSEVISKYSFYCFVLFLADYILPVVVTEIFLLFYRHKT